MTLTINHHLRGLLRIYGGWLDEIFGGVGVVIADQTRDMRIRCFEGNEVIYIDS